MASGAAPAGDTASKAPPLELQIPPTPAGQGPYTFGTGAPVTFGPTTTGTVTVPSMLMPNGLPYYDHLNRAQVPVEFLNLDEIAQREAADQKTLRRAEKMHAITQQFLQNYFATAGDKAKQLECWRVYLEELDRKVNILHWIRTDDIWRAVATLPDQDRSALNSIYTTLTEKTFPKNFDEKLTYLRKVVGYAAAGNNYKVQMGVVMEKPPAPEEDVGPFKAAPLNISQLGLTPSELRAEGYLVHEMLDSGYKPDELIEAGFSFNQIRAGGVTVGQLLASGCLPTTALATELKKSGYKVYELSLTDSFSADQLLYAGYPRAEILAAGCTFNYPPQHMRRKQDRAAPPRKDDSKASSPRRGGAGATRLGGQSRPSSASPRPALAPSTPEGADAAAAAAAAPADGAPAADAEPTTPPPPTPTPAAAAAPESDAT